mmetsp:Transcript_28956/g.53214  ORF Transcript_28956/g.53214 Transcript_28956/m.53214 type:complete len:85 (+) Transcript_28956:271-525(+)
MDKYVVLGMYRKLIREARLLPTNNRKNYVLKKARKDFEDSRQEVDPERLRFLYSLAEVQYDNLKVQRTLLNKLKAEGNLKGPKD